jgi:MSHA biogenesis protein MshG
MRTLSALLRAGVPLHESLALAGETAGNTLVAEETRKAADAIRDGERATSALRPGLAFSPAALWSLRVAEERGDLVESLEGLADYFDDTATIGAQTFLTAAEPLAIAVVGLFAAATVLAMAAPTLRLHTMFY